MENVVCEIVNKVGVDINKIIMNKQLITPMQFICGLGALKCQELLNKIDQIANATNNNFSYTDRYELLEHDNPRFRLFREVVWRNALGFIKITTLRNFGQSQLDGTRVHPDGNYSEYNYN